MGAHRHGLRRLSSGRRSSAIPFNLDQTAAVVTLLVVGSWVIVPAFALEAPAQRAKAVVLDAPPKWAPALDAAARDRALAPIFVSEGVKSTLGLRARVKGATIERRRGRDAETILEREGGTKLVVVAAGWATTFQALARAAKPRRPSARRCATRRRVGDRRSRRHRTHESRLRRVRLHARGRRRALVAAAARRVARGGAPVVDAAPRGRSGATAAPSGSSLLALALGLRSAEARAATRRRP